jgi:crossover junction endodeoxyribonuclease RuvC
MRVLGIDCGSERTGFGVIDSDGRQHRIVAAGVIKTSARLPLGTRLVQIRQELNRIIQDHRPECAAVEDVFTALNVRSGLKLAHVRGVALLVVAEAGLDCGEYPPAKVKQSIVGHGTADKAQVEWMVRQLCQYRDEFATPDVSDAVAVAICHATHSSSQRLMRANSV